MQFQPGISGLHNVCLPVSHGGWTVASWNSWEYTNLDYDVFLYDGTMSGVISYSATAQSEVAGEPIEVIYGSPISDACIVVALSEDSIPQENSLLHINTVRGSVNDGLSMVQSSVSTPADAAGAVTVGAVHYADGTPELFSSAGPTDDGRDKPEICGFDGVSTTQGSFSPFLGTSAAAPHVAGAAALLLQEYSEYDASQIINTITSSASANNQSLCGAGTLSLENISTGGTGGDGTGGDGTGGDGSGGSDGVPPIVTVGADSISVQSIVSPPTHGTVQIVSDGTAILYTPNSNYHGLDSFVYLISDNSGETDTATVSLEITSVNDAPFVTPIIDYTINSGDTLSFTAIAIDADSADTLLFSLSDSAPAGSTINGITGEFSWIPSSSKQGDFTFDVVATDDGTPPKSDSESLTVTVVNGNNDDTVVDDTCATSQSGDWIITQSCTMSTSAVAPANILVQDNSVLTIPDGVTLDVDLQNYSIMVKNGSSIIIRDGGTII
ncbi:MAG: S8 family serine peptidase [Nitrosopumilaceae archaeon]|nr:S8 family serine peptidase [Nitrosopumilaceae archaeon]